MPTCAKCHRDLVAGSHFCRACGMPIVPEHAPGEALDPYIGQTVKDTYFIQRRVGGGGMGDVYKAVHVRLDKPVALKLLKKSLLADPALVERFYREARSASKLQHPNVINVTDFGQTEDGTLFMAMEYLAGKDLARVIAEERPLSEKRIVHLGAQVLAALAEAHAAGILHRDMKPENVMIESRRDEPDSVKVLDFGIASIQVPGGQGSTLTQAGPVCGTPRYMSPEQWSSEELDARSDLYSVGVMLYEMLTGQMPFAARTPMELVRKHLTEQVVPPSARCAGGTVSADLERLVIRALSPERDDRPSSADEMRKELLACLPTHGSAPQMRGEPTPTSRKAEAPWLAAPSSCEGQRSASRASRSCSPIAQRVRDLCLGLPALGALLLSNLWRHMRGKTGRHEEAGTKGVATTPELGGGGSEQGVHSEMEEDGLPVGGAACAPNPMATPEPGSVWLGASAPAAVESGGEFTVRLVAYLKELESEVREQLEKLSPRSLSHLNLRSCRWKPGTRVKVGLSALHLVVDPPEQEFIWDGCRNLVEFDVSVPAGAPESVTVLKLDVSIDGVVVARLRMDLAIQAQSRGAERASSEVEAARSAFASYASADRGRVLDRVAAVAIAAGMDVFLDCLDLHPGEEWERRLGGEIRARDIFLLFWSDQARQSPWVAWEWRTALREKGKQGMQIHPLEPDVGPPEELADLHFGDVYMWARKAGEQA